MKYKLRPQDIHFGFAVPSSLRNLINPLSITGIAIVKRTKG